VISKTPIHVQDKKTGARGIIFDLGAAHDPRVRVQWDANQRITRTDVKDLYLVTE
jgi:hypothetical protein